MGRKQRGNRGGQDTAKQESVMEEQIDPAMAGQEPNVGNVEPAAEQAVAEQQPADDANAAAPAEQAPAAPVVPESPAPEINQGGDGVTLQAPDSGVSGQVTEQAPAVQDLHREAAQELRPVSIAAAIQAETGVAVPAQKESLQVASIRHAMEDYIKKMAPGVPISVKDGAHQQVRLYTTLMTVVNRMSDSDFIQAMNIILDLFDKNAEGVFHPRYVFRFMEHIELTGPRITAFQRLLNMFHLMAPAASRRAAVDQCNWSETLGGEITDAGRNRVLSFFKVG